MLSQLSIVAMVFTAGNSFRTGTDLEKEQECGESKSSPEYFTSLREKYGVEECGKKDVCLLMRQLDAYFYSRALNGELVDYGAPPAGKWLRSGHCTRSLRSQKLAPVTSKEECKKILAEETKKKMKVIHNTKYPSGCILDFAKKRGRFNTAESDADAGVRYVNVFGKRRMDGMRKKVDIGQYCYDDYSLSESAASYYSPYKLKQSMVGRPEMSTSCSFGMMAHLDRVGLTDSPCAGILVGEKGTKAKNVLIEQITKNWCPGIWHEATEKGETCSAPRFPSWAKHGFVADEDEAERAEYLVRGIGGETKANLMASRTAKLGLPEGVCDAIEEELFDEILSSKGAKPDFFADATVK